MKHSKLLPLLFLLLLLHHPLSITCEAPNPRHANVDVGIAGLEREVDAVGMTGNAGDKVKAAGDSKEKTGTDEKDEKVKVEGEGDSVEAVNGKEKTKGAGVEEVVDGKDKKTKGDKEKEKDKTKGKGEGEKEKKKVDPNAMILSEISVGGLTSLLVTAFLLIIFVSGFMCLMNIQTPATFDISDEATIVKKMQ